MSATNVMTAMEKQMQKWLEGEVGRLATQYKFNKTEAMSYLRGEIERVAMTAPAAEKKAPKTKKTHPTVKKGDGKPKTVKSVDKPDMQQPEVPLPYCGEGADDQCCAVVLNHQMFTQCTHRVSGEFTTEGDGGATTLKALQGMFQERGHAYQGGQQAADLRYDRRAS